MRSTEFDDGPNLKLDGSRRKYRKILVSKLQRMKIEKDDILIEKSGGSPDQPVGRVTCITDTVLAHGEIAYSNFIEKIKPSTRHIDAAYLFHYLGMLHSIGITNRLQSQTNGIRNLMMNDYLKIPVSLPPLIDQRKISALMSKAYAQKTELESKAKALLACVDDVIYRHLGLAPPISKEDTLNERIFKMRLSEVGGRFDPFANHPKLKHWFQSVQQGRYAFAPLYKIAQFKKEVVTSIPENMRYLGLENVNGIDGSLVETTEKIDVNSALVFKPGDILFPKLRPNLNKTRLSQTNGVCSTEFHVLQTTDMLAQYLVAYLRSTSVVSVLTQLVTGNTLPRLQTEDILRLPIITPPIEVQQKIVSEISSIHTEAQALRQQAKTCLEDAKQLVEKMILG